MADRHSRLVDHFGMDNFVVQDDTYGFLMEIFEPVPNRQRRGGCQFDDTAASVKGTKNKKGEKER